MLSHGGLRRKMWFCMNAHRMGCLARRRFRKVALTATSIFSTVISMNSTVSISEGQNNFPALVKAAERGRVVTVTRHDDPVACVIGHERLGAIIETLELLANPVAMRAIREHRAGKTEFGSLADIE